MKTCQDCKYYKLPSEHEGKKYGFCFRMPPEVLEEGKSTSPVVLAVRPACGEFKRRWFLK